jgi:hypothetical protein
MSSSLDEVIDTPESLYLRGVIQQYADYASARVRDKTTAAEYNALLRSAAGRTDATHRVAELIRVADTLPQGIDGPVVFILATEHQSDPEFVELLGSDLPGMLDRSVFVAVFGGTVRHVTSSFKINEYAPPPETQWPFYLRERILAHDTLDPSVHRVALTLSENWNGTLPELLATAAVLARAA